MSRVFANLHLRTKFLHSFVLVTAGLTCAALLVVRHTARVQMQREIEEDAHNAILTFQIVQRQHHELGDRERALVPNQPGDAASEAVHALPFSAAFSLGWGRHSAYQKK